MEGNLRFKIDWANPIVARKFTVFVCFTLYLRAISKKKPPGSLYLEGRFNGGFFCVTSLGGLYLEGVMHGGAYFRNFTVTCGVTSLSHEKPALRGQYCSPKGCCLTVDQ